MKPKEKTGAAGWVSRAASAISLCLVLVVLGFLAGGLLATRVFSPDAMGWDALANALGGFMIGSAGGLLVGIGAAFLLDARRRWQVTLVLGGVALVALLVIRIVAPRTAPQDQEEPPLPREVTLPAEPVPKPDPEL